MTVDVIASRPEDGAAISCRVRTPVEIASSLRLLAMTAFDGESLLGGDVPLDFRPGRLGRLRQARRPGDPGRGRPIFGARDRGEGVRGGRAATCCGRRVPK